MKIFIKILGLTVFAIIAVYGISFLTDKTSYSNWTIENISKDTSTISWSKFEWTNGELAGKKFDKLSMNIPCKIDGIANNCTFQFDLGSGLTGVYENTFNSLYTINPKLEYKIRRLKSGLQFWNSNKYFESLNITFGNYIATNKVAYVYRDFGEKIESQNPNDTIHLGTIGADLFKDRFLIIDYPKKQFAICEKVPTNYQDFLIDIELSNNGSVILPLKINNKKYRINFDNGSSIFPLITLAKNITNYSTSADIDTIQIPSWGQIYSVTGKLIKDTFELAGQKYCNVKVYANHSGFGIDKTTDGMTGNALFWDRTIIIDFKNKKFGVK
jgi:hypothetical protein